jgi:hypothetical protein
MSLIRTTDTRGQRVLITSHAVASVTETETSKQYHGHRCVIRLLDGQVIDSVSPYQTIVDQMAYTPGGYDAKLDDET